jgi:DNA invertase Pin-like site-specific DNA recombinase
MLQQEHKWSVEMLIGYGLGTTGEAESDDRAELQALGCERILIDSPSRSDPRLRETLGRITDFLRRGDTLVVVSLDRLGQDLDSVVRVLAQLHGHGVEVHAHREKISAGTDLSRTLPQLCATLRTIVERDRARSQPEKMRRGRPKLLSPELVIRAQMLLGEERRSVGEVARLLKVSPATLYRYCPRPHLASRARALKPEA